MKQQFILKSDYQPSGDQPQAIQLLNQGLNDGLLSQTLLGVTGSGKTFTMAQIIAKQQRPAMILAHNKTLAAQLYSEMRAFFPENAVEYFVSYYDYYQPEAYVPASDTYIAKDSAVNEHIEQMRLSATKALMERRDTIIVCTVSAIYGLGDPQSYLKMVLHVSEGEKIEMRAILHRLSEMQYTRNDFELKRGTYRVRGENIDIFPAENSEIAIRLVCEDDQITKIRSFDPLTGKIVQQFPRTTIFPKTHYVTSHAQLLNSIDDIKEELRERLEVLYQENKLVEAQRLQQRVQYDLEMMIELGYCTGIENYSRYLSGKKPGEPPPTLFNYLPADGLLFLDESHVTIPQLHGMYRGDRSRKETLVEYGFRLPSALDNRPLKFEEFQHLSPQHIFVSATPGRYEEEHAAAVVEQIVRPTGLLDPKVEVRPAKNQIDDLLSEINLRIQRKERTLVTTLTKKMSEDLSDYLQEHGIKVRYLHADIDTVERVEIIRDLRRGIFDVLVGINLLREGLDIPEVSLVAILDADKEGFLRTERSLIQTIGRAARNSEGTAILYADKITQAMETAIRETNRRRQKQEEYNQKNGITPKTINKAITDILQVASSAEEESVFSPMLIAAEEISDYKLLSQKQLEKEIKKLQKKMEKHAKNLEFEQAAQTRDQLKRLENIYLVI